MAKSLNTFNMKVIFLNKRGAVMGFYLVAYWIILILFLIVYGMAYFLKKKKLLKLIEDYSYILLVVAFSLLFIGILKNDPLFEPLGLPREYEWLGALISSGFGLWWFYLNPLKERVITTEKDVSSIKTDVSAIREDVVMIKEEVIHNKIKK